MSGGARVRCTRKPPRRSTLERQRLRHGGEPVACFFRRGGRRGDAPAGTRSPDSNRPHPGDVTSPPRTHPGCPDRAVPVDSTVGTPTPQPIRVNHGPRCLGPPGSPARPCARRGTTLIAGHVVNPGVRGALYAARLDRGSPVPRVARASQPRLSGGAVGRRRQFLPGLGRAGVGRAGAVAGWVAAASWGASRRRVWWRASMSASDSPSRPAWRMAGESIS